MTPRVKEWPEDVRDYAHPDAMLTVRRYRAYGEVYIRKARRLRAGILTDKEWRSRDRLRRGLKGYRAHLVSAAYKQARTWYEAAMRVLLIHGGHDIPSARPGWVAPECRVSPAAEETPS